MKDNSKLRSHKEKIGQTMKPKDAIPFQNKNNFCPHPRNCTCTNLIYI